MKIGDKLEKNPKYKKRVKKKRISKYAAVAGSFKVHYSIFVVFGMTSINKLLSALIFGCSIPPPKKIKKIVSLFPVFDE